MFSREAGRGCKRSATRGPGSGENTLPQIRIIRCVVEQHAGVAMDGAVGGDAGGRPGHDVRHHTEVDVLDREPVHVVLGGVVPSDHARVAWGACTEGR